MTSKRVSKDARDLARKEGIKYTAALARMLNDSGGSSVNVSELLRVLGITDLETYDPTLLWEENEHRPNLDFPLGNSWHSTTPENERTGDTVVLDFVEMSRGGHGPHGCIQGKTGTGKSYLINNMVVALTARHSPSKLALALVDFKGSATFDGIENLPHVKLVLKNAEEHRARVVRLLDTLDGEVKRREELLYFNEARDIHEYRSNETAMDVEPLPYLLFIFDEFHEFMLGNRDLLKLFTRIGAKGRSLGIHLLIGAQFIDAGLLSDLMNHLTYGISLASSSAAYSRTVLDGDPSAVTLKAGSGDAYVRKVNRDTSVSEVVAFRGFSKSVDSTDDGGKYVRDEASFRTLVQSIQKTEWTKPPEIWLKPTIDVPICFDDLDDMFGDRSNSDKLVIGVVDDPFHHTKYPLEVDISGNVEIIGVHGVGKTTAAAALVAASRKREQKSTWLIISDSPDAVTPFKQGGNVAAYAHVKNVDGVDRILSEAYTIVRDAIKNGNSREDDYGDLFVLVDGYRSFNNNYYEHKMLPYVVKYGADVGVRVVITNDSLFDLRLSPYIRFSIALKCDSNDVNLNNTPENEKLFIKEAIKNLNRDESGSCVTSRDRNFARIALPVSRNRMRSKISDEHRGLPARYAYDIDYVSDIREFIDSLDSGNNAKPLATVPDIVQYEDVALANDFGGLALGADKGTARVFAVLDDVPHLLVFGNRGSGKTTALKTLIESIMRRYTPEQARVAVIDPSVGLTHEVKRLISSGYMEVEDYATTPLEAGEVLSNKALQEETNVTVMSREVALGIKPPHEAVRKLFVIIDDVDRSGVADLGSLRGKTASELANRSPYVKFMVSAPSDKASILGASDKLCKALLEGRGDVLLLRGDPSDGRIPYVKVKSPSDLPAGDGTYVSVNYSAHVNIRVAQPPTS